MLCLPVLGGRRPIALPSILEPVAHLGGRQPGRLRQLALLGRIRVRILQVPLAQQAARALLEAVRLLFAVPDGARQRELFAHPVLVDGTCGGRRCIERIYNFNRFGLCARGQAPLRRLAQGAAELLPNGRPRSFSASW